jgi:hypothetical protein
LPWSMWPAVPIVNGMLLRTCLASQSFIGP